MNFEQDFRWLGSLNSDFGERQTVNSATMLAGRLVSVKVMLKSYSVVPLEDDIHGQFRAGVEQSAVAWIGLKCQVDRSGSWYLAGG